MDQKTFETWARRTLIMPNGCLEWQGPRNKDGYGYIWDRARRRNAAVHRLVYEHFVGPLPVSKYVVIEHTCENPPCSSPAHLAKVTQSQNMLRFWKGPRRN